MVEQADYAATKELFGDYGGVNLDTFLPKSVKDFDDYASTVAMRFIVGHKESKNYKAFLKALVKYACEPLPSTEVKDIETSLAGVRSGERVGTCERAHGSMPLHTAMQPCQTAVQPMHWRHESH